LKLAVELVVNGAAKIKTNIVTRDKTQNYLAVNFSV
jgi:hypothetical protein